ncbi:hypothetical protein BCR34DRAFT_120641 [Clohesyomyces aquaticus]|uniref:Uncharacterized protein n=1 Tax=Clohesyomyces aquaticus TaxID=1231657 RepID=A0A1Y2A2R6_9PLEO|nr:hypothetical protein BCR34DRAFT_120641 [Clohesyomyces aquaticus]
MTVLSRVLHAVKARSRAVTAHGERGVCLPPASNWPWFAGGRARRPTGWVDRRQGCRGRGPTSTATTLRTQESSGRGLGLVLSDFCEFAASTARDSSACSSSPTLSLHSTVHSHVPPYLYFFFLASVHIFPPPFWSSAGSRPKLNNGLSRKQPKHSWSRAPGVAN